MDKDVAISILALSKSLDGVIAKMFDEVERIDDQALKAKFKRAVGDLMGYVARGLIFPIEDIYPDIKVDH